MGSPEGARQILAGLKEAGINLVASVPDINMLQLINLLYEDKEIAHVPVGREEEGIGVCTGAHLAGKQPAMLMQNGGLLNSCNGLTTTALQFGIPYLCLYRSFNVLPVPEVLLFTVLTPIYVTLLDDALARRFNRWALLAAAVAVGGGIIIRFKRIEGDYVIGFLLLQFANATFAAGQVLCRRLLLRYEPSQPL